MIRKGLYGTHKPVSNHTSPLAPYVIIRPKRSDTTSEVATKSLALRWGTPQAADRTSVAVWEVRYRKRTSDQYLIRVAPPVHLSLASQSATDDAVMAENEERGH